MWDTYETIFASLEEAFCQILRRFAEHSIPFGSGGRTPRMECECEVWEEHGRKERGSFPRSAF